MRRSMLVTALVVVTALALPAAAASPERVDLRLPTDAAPADALYVEQRFDFAMTAEDVVYGEAVNVYGETENLTFELWEPIPADGGAHPDGDLRPVIVWATGGGFTRVARSLFYFMPQMLERGYVVLNITYRVRPDMPHGFEEFATPDGAASIASLEPIEATRDAQHDMQAAIRYVRANAADLGVDPTRLVAGGYSAGGAMAWSTTYNTDDPGDSGNPGWPSHVAAGLIGAGGYILPLQGVMTPGETPIVAFHGTHDTTVPSASSIAPCAATTAMGNTCELHLHPDRSHNLSAVYPEIAALSADFLWRHVIAADRIVSSLDDLDASDGAVTGLLTASGDPLAGERVLVRVDSGPWTTTTTDAAGAFSAAIGGGEQVTVRYEGFLPESRLSGEDTIAPAITTTPVRRGGAARSLPAAWRERFRPPVAVPGPPSCVGPSARPGD